MTDSQTSEEIKNGSQTVVSTLLDLGVEVVFGYPGGAVLPLYDTLYDGEIRHILNRHEQGCIHAAEGYAKVTGKPGVAIVTSGPGATNAITGIADAMSDSVPLIVFTGQVTTPGIGKDAFQEADILGLTMPITKYNYQVRDVNELPRVIKEAYHIANTGRKGPVIIDLPKDITINDAIKPNTKDIYLPGYQPTVSPNTLQVSKLMSALEASEKPVLLVGGGTVQSEASKELIEFAEKYNIPVISTLMGLGAFPVDNELFLGMGGMHGSFASNMALTDCDFLINMGSRFDDRLASAPDEFATNAIIAHIDVDPAEIGKVIDTQIPIVGDVKQVLNAINEITIDQPSNDEWKKLCLSRKELHPFGYDRNDSSEIKPQHVIEEVGKITDGEAIVVTDVGQHQMWVAQYYPFKFDHQLITSGGLGTMGFGIPAAVGAQLAAPDKDVVVFVGDGGFQMTNQEMAILNEYDLPIKIILLNNHSLGMVRQWQERFFDGRCSESVFDTQPDFVKMAEAYHIKGVRLSNAETFDSDLEAALKEAGPVLIEVEVSKTEHVLPMVPAGKPNNQMIGVE